tara:strand:+ start:943 stop:1383 length:441 start_codon:yes stop_codon:yes gene_type:complete
MQDLNLPKYSFKIKNEDGKIFIFDCIRKKYLYLSPEEWVRQNFIMYLKEEKGYPSSLIAVEMTIDLLNTKKRCDIVLFNIYGEPNIIVECKSPKVNISRRTFDQISRYNMSLKTDMIIVTNGLEHYFCRIDHKNKCYNFLKDIPNY